MADTKPPMSAARTMLFLICIFGWIALFCSGINIGTKYYRQQLDPVTGTDNLYFLVYSWMMMYLNYSMSNIALLCCLSAVIGGMTHENPDNLVQLVAKGLFVYLLTLAGLLIAVGNQVVDMPQSQYVSVAASSSMVAFVVGYFPEVFNKMLFKARDKVADDIDNPPNPNPPAPKVVTPEPVLPVPVPLPPAPVPTPVTPPVVEVLPPVEAEPKH